MLVRAVAICVMGLDIGLGELLCCAEQNSVNLLKAQSINAELTKLLPADPGKPAIAVG
jgi:hypothetical protein